MSEGAPCSPPDLVTLRSLDFTSLRDSLDFFPIRKSASLPDTPRYGLAGTAPGLEALAGPPAPSSEHHGFQRSLADSEGVVVVSRAGGPQYDSDPETGSQPDVRRLLSLEELGRPSSLESTASMCLFKPAASLPLHSEAEAEPLSSGILGSLGSQCYGTGYQPPPRLSRFWTTWAPSIASGSTMLILGLTIGLLFMPGTDRSMLGQKNPTTLPRQLAELMAQARLDVGMGNLAQPQSAKPQTSPADEFGLTLMNPPLTVEADDTQSALDAMLSVDFKRPSAGQTRQRQPRKASLAAHSVPAPALLLGNVSEYAENGTDTVEDMQQLLRQDGGLAEPKPIHGQDGTLLALAKPLKVRTLQHICGAYFLSLTPLLLNCMCPCIAIAWEHIIPILSLTGMCQAGC